MAKRVVKRKVARKVVEPRARQPRSRRVPVRAPAKVRKSGKRSGKERVMAKSKLDEEQESKAERVQPQERAAGRLDAKAGRAEESAEAEAPEPLPEPEEVEGRVRRSDGKPVRVFEVLSAMAGEASTFEVRDRVADGVLGCYREEELDALYRERGADDPE